MNARAAGTKGEKVIIRKIAPSDEYVELIEIEFENAYGHWQSVRINSEIFNTMLKTLGIM